MADHQCRGQTTWSLPVEIGNAIVHVLNKSNLKVLRLVSKGWNDLAIPCLFDRVWFSPRKMDIQVLENIAKSKHLAPHVQTLMLDLTLCVSIEDLPLYIKHLRWLADNYYESWLAMGLDPSHPILRLAEDTRFIMGTWDLATMEPGDYEGWGRLVQFLKESHVEWQALVAKERALYRSEYVPPLSAFENLRHMQYDNGLWEGYIAGTRNGMGTPFGRSRDPWLLKPTKAPLSSLDVKYRPWFILDQAILGLKELPHDLLSFGCQEDNSPAGWELDWFQRTLRLRETIAAPLFDSKFSNLRSLKLCANFKPLMPAEVMQQWGFVFRPWLRRLQFSLRDLSICLYLIIVEDWQDYIRDSDAPGILHFTFDQIFSQVDVMPRLQNIQLSHCAVTYTNIDSLRNMCPNLSALSLGQIKLYAGTWPGVIEALASLGLKNFQLTDKTLTRGDHDQPEMLYDIIISKSFDDIFEEWLGSYILNKSRRHPCLPDGVPNESSLWYTLENVTTERSNEIILDWSNRGLKLPPQPVESFSWLQ